MKRILVSISILFTMQANAQWHASMGGKMPHTAYFASFDTILFSSFVYPNTTPELICRTKSQDWHVSQDGIDLSHTAVWSMAFLGPYSFAAASNVYISSNNGAQWKEVNITGPPGSNGKYLFAVAFSGWTSGPVVARSTNLGVTWDSVCATNVNAYGNMGSVLFASGKELWRSSDPEGLQWSKVNYPLSMPLLFATAQNKLFATTFKDANGIAVSVDSGIHWSTMAFNHIIQSLTSDGEHLFAGTRDSGIYVSTDLGQSWTQHNEGLGSSLSVQAMAVFDTLLYLSSGTDGNYFNGYRPLLELVPPHNAVESPVAVRDTIAIYPNPTTSSIRIDFGSATVQRIELLNVLGESKQELQPREQSISLDLSQLPSGTYFLRFETTKGTVMRKVVRE